MRTRRISSAETLFAANPPLIAVLLIAERCWFRATSLVMAQALKAPGLYWGPGCRVYGGRHIRFGRGVFANRNLWLEANTSYRSQTFTPSIAIGDRVAFSDGVHISAIEKIEIGNDVLFGSKIYVSDHAHGNYRGEHQSSSEEPPAERPLGGGGPVTIGDNVWIGDNVVIVGPVSVGRGAIIAANSVVRAEVPPNAMVAGAPARIVKIYNPKSGLWERA